MLGHAVDARPLTLDTTSAFVAPTRRDMLSRIGAVATCPRSGAQVVAFDPRYCPGCRGRCGVGVGAAQLAVPASRRMPVGAPVLVAASGRWLRRATLAVFGPPLVAIAAIGALAHFGAWRDWTLAVTVGLALVTTLLLARLRGGP